MHLFYFLPLLSLTAVLAQTDEDQPCHPYELIICRATTEPPPLGYTLGPNTKSAVEAAFNATDTNIDAGADDILILGLTYPASFDIPSSPQTGTDNLVARIKTRAEKCPDTLFAMTGYSQGADVVHHALQHLAAQQDRIRAIAMFGDPLTSVGFPRVYQGRVRNTCNKSDRSCGGEGITGHMAYGRQPEAYEPAASFIVEELTAPTPPVADDPRPTMSALPEPGEAADFLSPMVTTWPPAEWAEKYTDGWVAEPVWV